MTEPPIVLRCLQGASPPAGLGADLQRLVDLPDAARRDFWRVLGVYLQPELDDAGKEAIVAYCKDHDLGSDDIAPAVRATRFLFQAAARANLAHDELAADLERLLPVADAQEAASLLGPWLEDFLPPLRRALLRETIADHGKLVTGTAWRVDRITSSHRAEGLSQSVAVVTFSYREGEQARRITFHLMPEQLDALRKAADHMLA